MKALLTFIIICLCAIDAFGVGDPRAMKANAAKQGPAPGGQQAQGQVNLTYRRQKKQLHNLDVDMFRPAQLSMSEDETDAIVDELKQSAEGWTAIASPRAKEAVMRRFIDEFREKGIEITQSPAHYAAMADALAAQNPDMVTKPFERVVEVMAIIEYDFNNGRDKDAMAKKVLGEAGYINNKKRLGLE